MDSTRDVVGKAREREKKMTDVSTSESIALKSSGHRGGEEGAGDT